MSGRVSNQLCFDKGRLRSLCFKQSTETGGSVPRVVSVLDSGAVGPGFKSQPRCCRVTVLGRLFTPITDHCSPSREIGSGPLKGCEGNCGPGGK